MIANFDELNIYFVIDIKKRKMYIVLINNGLYTYKFNYLFILYAIYAIYDVWNANNTGG